MHWFFREIKNRKKKTAVIIFKSKYWFNKKYGLPWWLSGKESAAMQETRVRPLGLEDLLAKEIATDSSILAWETPRTEEPGGLQSMELQESDMI